MKRELLDLLRHDPEVREAVRQAAAPEETPMLAPLTTEEAALFGLESPPESEPSAELADALATIERQNRQIESLWQQQAKMQDVMAAYARLERVYGHYLELPASVRPRVSEFLNDSSPLAFAVTGARLSAVCGLYQVICDVWTDCTSAELNALNECFDLVFDLFLLGASDFRRIVTHEGERFDPAIHTLSADSTDSGHIQQVIISGFEGEDIRVRSLVRTGEWAFDGE